MHAPRLNSLIDPELLMRAYRSGIFPMSDRRDDPEIFWIEPRLRAILPIDGFRLSHSLARTLRRGRLRVTCNQAFSQVMDACAAPRPIKDDEDGNSWISHRIQASYENLHFLGLAHSIEVWQDIPQDQMDDGATPSKLTTSKLVGGLYGVGFDRVFCGESMFSTVNDSSKVALAWLVATLRRNGSTLLDCQFMTSHLASLGAVEIPQKKYLKLLNEAQYPNPEPYSVVAGGSEGATGAVAAAGADGAEDGAAEACDFGLSLPAAFGALLDEATSCGLASSPGKFIAQFLTQTS